MAPRLDILINCAGTIEAGDLDTIEPHRHQRQSIINTKVPFLLMQAFKPLLVQAVRETGDASIVNVSCLKGSSPQPGLISYCMSKAGLEMLTKSAAIELAQKGVRVNCISPSFIPTGFWKNQANLSP